MVETGEHGDASKNLTRELARRAADVRYEALPAGVQRLVRQCVLDFFAVALAGAAEPLVTILRDDARAEAGTGRATVIGHAERLPPLAATLVNGAASHALDYDDVNLAMLGHPSVTLLPALLALGEERHASGRALMESFVAGYETECRIGAALGPAHYDLGFHTTSTVGTFGAAAACARLLGLDAEQTARALGIAGTQAAGLKSMFGTMCKPFHAGKAGENGMRAARLAARGFTSREDVIECVQGFAETHSPKFRPEAALAEPEGGFHLCSNLFKYHAACYLTHASIENAIALRRRHGIDLRDVGRAIIRVDRACDRVCNIADPTDGLQAKFSLRHTTAMALAGIDTSGIAAFSAATANEPALVTARERIVVEFASGWPNTLSELVVELRDGRRLEARHDSGVPMSDLDEQERKLVAKFDALATPVLGARRADALRHAILAFDEVADVGEILQLARTDGG
jgi:2-methylcitrate dehydratase PrpD